MKTTKAFLILVMLLIASSIFAMLTGCNRANAQSGGGRSGGPTNWIPVVDSAFSDSYIYAIAYGNNRFVAGGEDSRMAYSTDGAIWGDVRNSGFRRGSGITAISYGNNRYVAVGGRYDYDEGKSYGAMVYSTDNGATWTEVADEVADSTFSDSYIHTIAYGNNRFVAVGDNGKMAYSTDGLRWTAVSDSTFGDSYIHAIAYGNNRFVAGGRGKMAYSSDGVRWTAVSDSVFDNAWINAIAYGNSRFVAGSTNGKMAYCDW